MYLHSYFKVDIYSHFFKLTCVTPRGREVINEFTKPYCKWEFIKRGRIWSREIVKVFGARTKDLLEYRYHINQYQDFLKLLADKGILPELVVTEIHTPLPGADSQLEMLPHWHPREPQLPVIEYLDAPEPTRKLVEMQTGGGKTFLATKRAVETGKRIVVILKPQFIQKWVADFEKHCGIKKKDVITVQGSAPLMDLIVQAKEGTLDKDVIILSNRTMQMWLKAYEQDGRRTLDQGYDCLPDEFLPLLGCGVRIIDEVHMDFHLNFKLDLYCHCPLTISLSATLISDDPFVARMYEIGYPRDQRFAGLAYVKFIESTALFYNTKRPDKLRTVEWGSTQYSQFAFENSIMKFPTLLQSFMDMIVFAIREYYLRDYVNGNRCLVYCGSIDLCTIVSAYLQKVFTDKDVRRYVEQDQYENLMDADISVSTVLSAGTGHDIDKLSTVILTNAMKSSASNIQGFGRLRNLPGITKRFVYFVCTDVPKHIEYHIKKNDLLLTRASICSSVTYPTQLG